MRNLRIPLPIGTLLIIVLSLVSAGCRPETDTAKLIIRTEQFRSIEILTLEYQSKQIQLLRIVQPKSDQPVEQLMADLGYADSLEIVNGCLVGQLRGVNWPLIWPSSVHPVIGNATGVLELMNSSGVVVARVGERFHMVGGEVPSDYFGELGQQSCLAKNDKVWSLSTMEPLGARP